MFPLKDNIPTRRTPYLTYGIIALCVFVYFGLQGGGILHGPTNGNTVKFAAIPYEITHPDSHCIYNNGVIQCGEGCGRSVLGARAAAVLTSPSRASVGVIRRW